MVVEIEQVEPSFDVFTHLAELTNPAIKPQGLGIAVRFALIMKGAPKLDFPCLSSLRCVLLNPRENFTVSFAFFEFSLQRFG